MKFLFGLFFVASAVFAESNVELTDKDQCNNLDQASFDSCSREIRRNGHFDVPLSQYYADDSASQAASYAPVSHKHALVESDHKTLVEVNQELLRFRKEGKKIKTAGGYLLLTVGLSLVNSFLIFNDYGGHPFYVGLGIASLGSFTAAGGYLFSVDF